MARKFLFATIVVTTLLFSISLWVFGEYWIAFAALLIGFSWLILEYYKKSPFPSLLFFSFIGMAILADFHHLSLPIILFGLSTDLAAWDLSRFFARIRETGDEDAKSDLCKRHLHKLLLTLFIGYMLALLPVFFRLSLKFIVLFILALLAMITLRSSILSLRSQGKNTINGS